MAGTGGSAPSSTPRGGASNIEGRIHMDTFLSSSDGKKKRRKRILHKIKLTEISGVDRPCQEGAMVTLMKREDEPKPVSKADLDILALRLRVAKAKAQITIQKAWSDEARKAALEARRHQAAAAQHRSVGGADHAQAAALHDQAAAQYDRVARQYGGSKLTTAALWGVAGLGGRAIQQRIRRRRAQRVGAAADAASASLGSGVGKQGYYVGLKHPDGSFVHHNVHAGNRRGARSKAQKDYPGHTVVRVHEKPHLKKAWSDAARQAALEARRRAATHRTKEGAIGHPDPVAVKHGLAAQFYERAHEHYNRGKENFGAKFFQRGQKISNELGLFQT